MRLWNGWFLNQWNQCSVNPFFRLENVLTQSELGAEKSNFSNPIGWFVNFCCWARECGGGVTACHATLVLTVQGISKVLISQLYYAIFANVTKFDANALPNNKQKTLSGKEFTSSQLSIPITMVCPMFSTSLSSEIRICQHNNQAV